MKKFFTAYFDVRLSCTEQTRINFLGLPLGQMSVQGMHILMRFSSTSILLLGHALTQEL